MIRKSILLMLAMLLAPAIVCAQSDDALPDAPGAVAAAADESSATLALASLPANAASETGLDLTARDDAPHNAEFVFTARPAPSRTNFAPAFDAAQGGHLDLDALFRTMDRPGPGYAMTGGYPDADAGAEKYHLKLMLWESLAFTGFENGFRLITDQHLRYLIAEGPYWRNYANSLGQWNMRRWWDGDSFLVDEIGHPMQGGVSAFIEIQNSPRQRALRLSRNREYWRSRFLGMMWATAFSAQQKIGPLGEAALGNAGGETYPLNCPYPCKNYQPGVTKYTNNTGWTDFIITPVVGTVWVMLEDFLDLEVSDRIQGDDRRAALPKIIRGALNPCRTMANAMRWRKPWYRDFQENNPDLHFTGPVRFLPGDEDAIRALPRYEVFPHVDAISLPVNTATCSHCRQKLYGPGVGFATRVTRWADFESDINFHSNASPAPSDRAGGSAVMATFGIRGGWTGARGALKASIRPGFLSYSRAYESVPKAGEPTPDVGRITHFATALAVSGDYNINRRVALRGVIGNTAVRYRDDHNQGKGIQKPPYLNFLSDELFITNENWTWQAGPVIRF